MEIALGLGAIAMCNALIIVPHNCTVKKNAHINATIRKIVAKPSKIDI